MRYSPYAPLSFEFDLLLMPTLPFLLHASERGESE